MGMVEHYQQSELYKTTEKKLKNIFENLQGEKGGKKEIEKSASYATNVIWQVSIHLIQLNSTVFY